MKGIVIDAKRREVYETDIPKEDGSGLKAMQAVVNGYIERATSFDEINDVFVDEEGMLKDEAEQAHWFWIEGAPQPYVGNGLVIGHNPSTGETIATTLQLEYVRRMVRFMSRQEVLAVCVGLPT